MRAFSDYMKEVPVPDTSDGQRTQGSSAATQILAAKRADPDADVSTLETEIDHLVYSLYGLTREEVAIIEESLHERAASREVSNDSVREESR